MSFKTTGDAQRSDLSYCVWQNASIYLLRSFCEFYYHTPWIKITRDSIELSFMGLARVSELWEEDEMTEPKMKKKDLE